MKFWKRINPERNKTVRSYLYCIGIGATIHVAILLFLSIQRRDITLINPLYIIDINVVFPLFQHNTTSFVLAFAVFIACIYAIRRLIAYSYAKSDDE